MLTAQLTKWRKGCELGVDGDLVASPRRLSRCGFVVPAGFSPGCTTLLVDGRRLVRLRLFELPFTLTIKLLLVDSRRIAPGAMVDGTEIATFAPPYIHDNFEAVAATREGGDTIVWIASDDNQSILQRSLLLKFRQIGRAHV